ncbi:hypothetical protein K443DRAFT_7662 [Laccaria amethystina LaAM-08-1]|uniref:Unplaced genomic scaffold K443scaffold_90, whole genome shotgun sequence n=1 Tax=Laccaria amethystina LaAM-08-1 TaxID=1095629 RepID=A0A0C9XFT3_9AGAR|nr:hypothetical protein K443DRAFT_7662 [Laccaria amethystina LaAM-08-1]
MSSLASIRSSNAAFSPSYPPIALFVGGTSGIGQAMAEAFGKYTQGNATIIIAGRNRAAADAIIAKLPKPTTPGVSHEFVECDATLMKNVHATTKEILSRHPKINFLVMSPGYMTLKGRDETEEGIDRKLALNYYARWTFANGLLPALKKAKEDGEDAKVCSVLGAGKGGEIDVEDLGLKKSFSVANAALASPTYTDLMMEELAERNPDLTFIHAYPGFVRTNLLSSAQSVILRATSGIINGLTYAVSTAPEDCAEYMWHGIFNTTKGAFRMGSHGENLGKKRYFGTEAQRKKLWEHSWESTKNE